MHRTGIQEGELGQVENDRLAGDHDLVDLVLELLDRRDVELPVSTNAPVESDRTVNMPDLETDIPTSIRRQLEPDLFSGLIRLDAPGVGNRIHKHQTLTAPGSGAGRLLLRVEHRPLIYYLHSDKVVPPDAHDHGLCAAGMSDRVRHDLCRQQLGVEKDPFWQVESNGLHDGSSHGRRGRLGRESKFKGLHYSRLYPSSPLPVTCDFPGRLSWANRPAPSPSS